MSYYIITQEDGLISGSGSTADDLLHMIDLLPGETLRAVDGPVDPTAFYWRDGLRPLPERPGEYARFDCSRGVWIDPDDLTPVRARALDSLTAAVAAARRRICTDLPFQDRIYQRKQDEAKRYLSRRRSSQSLRGFPALAREVGVTAETAYQVAQVWLNKRDMTDAALDAIDDQRRRAVSAIAVAQASSEIDQIVLVALAELAIIKE